jgi:di/tricarboxylate transporter
VSRKNHRINEKLGRVRLRAGDVVVLQGSESQLPEFMRNMGLLPLVERNLHLGLPKNGALALAVLAAAMLLTALGLAPVAVAFFGAAVMMTLLGIIPLRDMYRSVEGPILVMLAALIPVSDALRTTGVTDIIASGLAGIGLSLPPYGALALIMVAAMAVTPFLNNAATVLVMAPIAAQFADNLGYKPEAFLLAVAIGAGCDFLTPVGHQCNTLVMAPGGYRFSDYARLGFPLSVLVVVIAVPALMWFWAL